MTADEIEACLAELRTWLEQTAADTAAERDGRPDEPETPDLHTLLGAMIALRHEVNLQTRAARNQQEQSAEALRQLGRALDVIQSGGRGADPAANPDGGERALLNTLIDVFDALRLAGQEVGRLQENVWTALHAKRGEPAVTNDSARPRPLWATRLLPRLFGRGKLTDAGCAPAGDNSVTEATVRRLIEAMVAGYDMSAQRLERALREHGVDPIVSVGRPFDPERMEAVEVVRTNDSPAGQVVDETRRGYTLQGRVLRFAQVRVAMPVTESPAGRTDVEEP